MKLKGKVAIVAGGGQGIGEGIIRCVAEEGADIAVIDINPDTTKQIVEQVEAMGRKAFPVIADLTVEKQVYKAVQDSLGYFGTVDILVNSVGGVSQEMARMQQETLVSFGNESMPVYKQFSADVWDKYYQLNLKSHVMLNNAITPHFIKQRSGKIVNISSTAGRNADPGLMPYAAMKAGDISLTWSLAKALAPYNVTVNCVCPGFVYTPLWARGAAGYLAMAREALREAKKTGGELTQRFADVDLESMTPKEYWLKYIVLPSTPNGREQTAEDMGKAVVFFASEDAKNITGQVLHVDGGMVMR